jgi:hypothetical protein
MPRDILVVALSHNTYVHTLKSTTKNIFSQSRLIETSMASPVCAHRFLMAFEFQKNESFSSNSERYYWPGLPDFSSYKIPKREILTKLPHNIPNGRTIYQIATQYTK